MFIPNTLGKWSKKTGRDINAKTTYAAAKVAACAIVHLTDGAQKTPVRTDSSASRGNAEEEVATAKILFPPTVKIGIDDKFAIQGVTLRVVKIEPRFTVTGRLDHFEAGLARLVA